MSMYEMIKAQLGQSVPFAAHAGVEILEIGDGVAEAAMAETATSVNHIGSQHAGALYTCGETASGAAMAGAFASVLMSVRPVAAKATIDYLKIAKGTITAKAKTAEAGEELLAKLEAEGKVAFDVGVSLTDEAGVEVATMTVAWHVKKA